MDIDVPDKLEMLQKQLNTPLYIVGGYVRNALLGLSSEDVDIAAELTPDEVGERLLGSGFKLVEINKRLGTLKLFCGRYAFEYTTFRRDSYPKSGAHKPSEVCFTRDLTVDASRRDFKCNAVYFEVGQKKIVDPLGGVDDVKNRVLSATRTPDEVFREDGLRIMRLARQAAELGFDIERQTFLAAKANAKLLKDIAPERIRVELLKILEADQKYPELKLSFAHERGIRLLEELGALQYVLPELAASKGFDQRSKYHQYDVFDHTMEVLKYCPKSVRLAALLHDIAKPEVAVRDGNMKKHAEEGAKIAAKVLGGEGLRFSGAETKRIVSLVKEHMADLNCAMNERELRLYIVKHADIIEDLIALKRADILGSKLKNQPSASADRMEKLLNVMKTDGTPFSVKQLLVCGSDLIEIGVPPEKRGAVMNELFEAAVEDKNLRSRNAQLEFLERSK